ncbi:Na+/H+ antiporter [Paenirhodobacter enshiensis]|uniref:Sodium:proton antiporter n=1 Tax=Paenirhodobacter enshiensis TaxID=1105367 RepID=A0A086XV57_9RHOB|nr:Na+/H+ antiporter [Paenirhodobacter enshiensis]KFI25907.1 sodium:proton antiporter [Paenirhodobacter enshiensis]
METITTVLLLLVAVVISAAAARMLPRVLPLPLIQIAIGFAVSGITGSGIRLEPDIFFLLFLPPLLFLDGWRIPKEGLFRDIGTVLELAFGLVVFTTLGIGFLVHWLIPAIPLPVAFALAAILSPTDPVAVTAIAARVNVPRRLMHVLEGESLLNDASGLVCMRFAVAAAMTGAFSLADAAASFVWLVLGGLAIGIVVTWILTWSKNRVARDYGEDTGSQILVSLLIPFVAYLAAEKVGGSGILAAVAAGMTMSYSEQSGRALATTRIRRNAVWDMVQFALNGMMFVVLGEQLPRIVASAAQVVSETGHVSPLWMIVYVLLINVALVALRFLWVWVALRFSIRAALKRGDPPPAPGWRLVAATSVAGARGAITLAGILTIPFLLPDGDPFPARDLVIFLAACAIIVSLVLASVALPPLLKGLAVPAEPHERQQEDAVRAAAATAAIEAAQAMMRTLPRDGADNDLYTHASARLIDYYKERIAGYSAKEQSDMDRFRAAARAEREVWLAALQAEREAIYREARRNAVPDDVARRLVHEVDLLETRAQES